jgi:hypothetical protein
MLAARKIFPSFQSICVTPCYKKAVCNTKKMGIVLQVVLHFESGKDGIHLDSGS